MEIEKMKEAYKLMQMQEAEIMTEMNDHSNVYHPYNDDI
jgi:hypothetical protein